MQYFPIFDQLEQIRAPSSTTLASNPYDPSDRKVVGTLTATLFWRNLIKDILPPGNDGLIVVFENPCNPTFTYQINGPTVIFLGRGDHHDKDYDEYRITSNFFELHSFAVGASMYSGPPLDQDFCPFTISVYPSDEMFNRFSSDDPLIFTIAGVMIFVFTSAVFLLYDWTVERRQKLVLNTAERSNAIVTSLFPAEVCDRLADVVVQDNKNTGKKKSGDRPDGRLNDFLAEKDDVTVDRNRESPPIASLYPETTIVFADIAGFTKVSSTSFVHDSASTFPPNEPLFFFS